MSKTGTADKTPDNIAKLATETAVLPRLALLGVFGSKTAPMALVREASGDVERVSVGDRLSQGIVQAIDQDRLIIGKSGGRTKVLSMPGN